MFTDYRKEFDKWTEIKKLKKQKTFKDLTKENQKEELSKRFVEYLTKNEKEKLYYFVLASQNSNKVLIVKSPTKTSEIKEFLGYEWSAAKGNEGIKYLGGVQLEKLDGENDDEGNVALDEEDKRVLSNMFNLNNISTPLYDPSSTLNDKKINFLIKKNFNLGISDIPDELKNSITKASLVDMMDFRGTDFTKSINLTPNQSFEELETKWPSVKLGEIVSVKIGGTPSRSNSAYFKGDNLWVSISEMKDHFGYKRKNHSARY